MKNKLGALALAALLLALLAGAGTLYARLTREEPQMPAVTPVPQASTATAEPHAEVASPKPKEIAGPQQRADLAPGFTVYTEDGASVRLSDLRGRPAIVNFFASWCGPCRSEMPHFDEAYRAYGEEIAFLMVDLCAFGNDSVESAKEMLAQGGYAFPVCYDTQGEAMTAYAVRSMPTTIFLSADGVLVSKRIGAMTQAQLQQEIDGLLAK